jgi:putative transcriptional regulator
MAAKRDTFQELKQSIEALRLHREGKITLRTHVHVIEEKKIPEVAAADIRDVREHQNMSQAVFAGKLHVPIRTFQKWEQGAAEPNDQAKILILLTRKYPDTIERINSLMQNKRKKIKRKSRT